LAPQAIPSYGAEKGGVTKDAVTSARHVRRSGMSVRATSHPMGAATAQQIHRRAQRKMTVVTQRIEERSDRCERNEIRDGEAAVRS